MADPEVQVGEDESAADAITSGDVEMANEEEIEGNELVANGGESMGVVPAFRVSFIDYLKSPIIELLVGSGDEQTLLTAHERLLVASPYFAEKCSHFADTATKRRIEMPDDEIDPVGCFLQYLYTGEYFPRKLEDRKLEEDPSMPAIDDTGEQLLKHARVYTLADKLEMDELKTLAHSKIHRINSTAKGEIAYARFVYANTPREDTTIRKPVAAFWAHRSHVLRHEAEDEFRKMCLEFPQFGFDVLSLVLDAKEKGREKEHPGERSSRKRPRHSQG